MSKITVTFRTGLNKDRKVDIQDVVIVAVAYGSKPGDPKWNVLADLDKNDLDQSNTLFTLTMRSPIAEKER